MARRKAMARRRRRGLTLILAATGVAANTLDAAKRGGGNIGVP